MKNGDKSLLDRYIPITDWLRNYSYSFFRNDLRAGLTVGILLIPQGMAYAMLAGLPPVYGLYTAIVPLLIYAVFGTSRQLSIGPVAIISILISAGVGKYATHGTEEYIALVLVTAFLVGCTQVLMGLFRLGFLMNFLSQPVLSGFLSGAAFIIGFSQLGSLVGVDLISTKYIYQIIGDLWSKAGQIHLPTLFMGLGCILIITLIKHWKPVFPAELLMVMLSIIAVWILELNENGLSIVGSVDKGIPTPAIPKVFSAPVEQMIPMVLVIAFLSFTQSIALSKAMVRRHPEYELDSNQELFGIGLANLIGSVFHAYPVAGSFSRTAVNEENRARTSISLIITALLVGLTVFFLTPLIYYLPHTVLAAIIITAVPGLIDVGEAKSLWKIRKREFFLMFITFLSTLIFGIMMGVGIGVLISLGIVMHRSSYPNIVMLGRLPDTNQYRDLERHPEGITQTNTIIVRIDASLYFANISYMREKLEELELESGKHLEQVIIDAIGINEVDYSALHALKELSDDYEKRGIELMFTGVKGPVRDIFERSGLEDIVGKEHFYLNINEAVENLEHESEEESHLVKQN